MGDITTYGKSIFESIKKMNEYGAEYWTGRELAKVLEYSRWDNFLKVVEKAKEACANSNLDVADHIAEVSNMIKIGKGGQ